MVNLLIFLKKIKDFTKSKYAIAVSSCTAGLHLSCLASNFKKGDEVIVPAQTHTATAHAVEYTGAKVVFSDVDFPSGNITLKLLMKKITKKTKGNNCSYGRLSLYEMKKISDYCKKKVNFN